MRITTFVKVGDLIITRRGYTQYWLIVDLTYNTIVFYNFQNKDILKVTCADINENYDATKINTCHSIFREGKKIFPVD